MYPRDSPQSLSVTHLRRHHKFLKDGSHTHSLRNYNLLTGLPSAELVVVVVVGLELVSFCLPQSSGARLQILIPIKQLLGVQPPDAPRHTGWCIPRASLSPPLPKRWAESSVLYGVPSMPKAMVDSLLAINDSAAATRYPDRVKQRAFLDEKTVALTETVFSEGFSAMIGAIARDKSLYGIFFNMKNLYHQKATGPGGVIGGRYPVILDLCSRIKTERELNRIGSLYQA
ncbi:hypothetical protein B0H14DRAFT_2639025 [Mycena olivaceomarginata]|nr:hypothetical protein B0H14DRAFT_2639025 [Mycena olivaceomarginata]